MRVESKLFLECHNTLDNLTEKRTGGLLSNVGHRAISGNEVEDLARLCAGQSIIGSESAVETSDA